MDCDGAAGSKLQWNPGRRAEGGVKTERRLSQPSRLKVQAERCQKDRGTSLAETKTDP